MHFVGDIHQPLHASDHQDKGGNCIAINPVEGTRSNNLHAWWDTGVLAAPGVIGGGRGRQAGARDHPDAGHKMEPWTLAPGPRSSSPWPRR